MVKREIFTINLISTGAHFPYFLETQEHYLKFFHRSLISFLNLGEIITQMEFFLLIIFEKAMKFIRFLIPYFPDIVIIIASIYLIYKLLDCLICKVRTTHEIKKTRSYISELMDEIGKIIKDIEVLMKMTNPEYRQWFLEIANDVNDAISEGRYLIFNRFRDNIRGSGILDPNFLSEIDESIEWMSSLRSEIREITFSKNRCDYEIIFKEIYLKLRDLQSNMQTLSERLMSPDFISCFELLWEKFKNFWEHNPVTLSI